MVLIAFEKPNGEVYCAESPVTADDRMLCDLGPQSWRDGDGEIGRGLGWNVRIGGALDVLPVDCDRFNASEAAWAPVEGAKAAIDEICLSRAFLRPFEVHYDAEAPENQAVWREFTSPQPAFEFYGGENFYTIDDFARIVADLKLGPPDGEIDFVREAWPYAVGLIARVLEIARELDSLEGRSFGVLVFGP